ncbi:MAG: alpha/beta hydrolase [Bacteroidota bacterium]
MKLLRFLLFLSVLPIIHPTATWAQASTTSPIRYIHAEKPSFQSKMLQSIFGLLGVKKGRQVQQQLSPMAEPSTPAPIPRGLRRRYQIQQTRWQGQPVWAISPKTGASEKVILYLHGGAYLFSINKQHWQFAARLADQTQATIIMPDYPVAPASSGLTAFWFAATFYQELLTKYTAENISLMGDSAGGGLVLALAMNLRKNDLPQPSQILLLSPWLDITMVNPDIESVDPKDKIFSIETLQKAGEAYAGGFPPQDYRLSPIYGDLSDLAPISVFIGTHDLFLADCRKLVNLSETVGAPLHYFEYPTMFHGWFMVGGLKEAKAATHQISALIRGELGL